MLYPAELRAQKRTPIPNSLGVSGPPANLTGAPARSRPFVHGSEWGTGRLYFSAQEARPRRIPRPPYSRPDPPARKRHVPRYPGRMDRSHCGVMFSGKSEELIRRVRRALIAGRSTRLFKSHLDDRYGGVFRISSHDGRELEAIPVNHSVQIAEQVPEGTQVVAIDEAQFLDEASSRWQMRWPIEAPV